MAKDSGKSFFRFYIYIQIGKKIWKIFFQIIYIQCGKKCGKSFLKDYIYNVAKSLGKLSENHKHNYRQLQLWIKWIKMWIKCG